MEASAILEGELRSLKARISKLEAELAQARERLPGLEHAFNLLSGRANGQVPRTRSNDDPVGFRSSGGRQPGAISNRWKAVLASLYQKHDIFKAEDVVETVRALEQRETRAADARRVLDSHMSHGYVEAVEGGYRISGLAVEKFDLGRDSARNDRGPADAGPDPQSEGEAGLPEGPDKAAPTGPTPVSSTASHKRWDISDDEIPF